MLSEQFDQTRDDSFDRQRISLSSSGAIALGAFSGHVIYKVPATRDVEQTMQKSRILSTRKLGLLRVDGRQNAALLILAS